MFDQAKFEAEVGTVAGAMNSHKRIFGAGFSSGGPTAMDRTVAGVGWDRGQEELVELSAVLFKEVGGSEAFKIFTETLSQVPQQHSPSHLKSRLTDDMEFLRSVLIAATTKPVSAE